MISMILSDLCYLVLKFTNKLIFKNLTRIFEMTTPQRIEALKKNARRLWPKYDPDLDTMVNGRKKIHQYINHVYEETKLKPELE